jgi:diguanylate cyclase (GGDEF)-like protein
MQTAIVNSKFIYLFIVLFYINVIGLSTYIDIWAYQDKATALFLCFLLCALLMFVIPPLFNLCLTLGAIGVFIVCTTLVKSFENMIFDIVNMFIAGTIGLFFSWQFTKLRIGLELSANILEDERNSYFDQSTIDELTQLNNRRDFMKTFQRYLTGYRTSDNWLCIAIADIDFFKNYNDHYGHPKGDDCLRSVGSAFNTLKEEMGVYTARVGGEEFAMLWFEKDASRTDAVVTSLSNLIKQMNIPHEKSKVSNQVTMSVGVYIERVGASDETDTLYNLADKALYAAKKSGRNCAIISGREIVQYKIA